MKTCIAALGLILAPMATAQTFRVSGVVVESESGVPLNRTRMVLTGGPVPEQSVVTIEDGRFSFEVPRGKYTLLASHRNFGESYGQNRSGTTDTSIVTGRGQDTTGIVMRWHAPAAIHGKVVDESGEPIHAATVELFTQTVAGGKKRIQSMGRAESDEFGNYSWSALRAGTYYLAVTGQPWFSADRFARAMLTEAGRPPLPFALTYYPAADDARGALPLTLPPGAEVRADFTLKQATGANLRFVCPTGTPCGGTVSLYAAGPGGLETLVRPSEATESGVIPAVLPGRYTVLYSGADGDDRKMIEVNGSDLTVEIEPKPAPVLAGKVTLRNPKERPRHPLYVNVFDEDSGKAFGAAVDGNGKFSWREAAASHVRLTLSGADGYFVARSSVDGARVTDGVIDVANGAHVQVNLIASDETGRLSGLVMDGETPVPMSTVILAPPNGSTNQDDFRAFQTDSDGSFDFNAIPPGDYVLFATDNQELEYANPEVLHPYLASSKNIRIEPHSVKVEKIVKSRGNEAVSSDARSGNLRDKAKCTEGKMGASPCSKPKP